MPSLAMNVHHWGGPEQRRLLCDCLGPEAARLRAAGLARWFWYMPFDARGPHVHVRLGVVPGAEDAVRAALSRAVGAYCRRCPSTVQMTDDALRTRHEQCRGKTLCGMDRQPGIAPNNSFGISVDEAEGTEGEALRAMEDAAAFWAIDRLRDGTQAAAAVRWAAAVWTALAAAHPAPERYWRHHAGTLLPRFSPAALDPGAAPDLAPMIGARNLATFGGAWAYEWRHGPVWPHAEPLVAQALAAGSGNEAAGWRLLRDFAHRTLLQLGQPVKLHVPLVLYAWHRTLPARAAAA